MSVCGIRVRLGEEDAQTAEARGQSGHERQDGERQRERGIPEQLIEDAAHEVERTPLPVPLACPKQTPSGDFCKQENGKRLLLQRAGSKY